MHAKPVHGQLDIDALAPEVIPGIRLMPVVHARVEMAALVRVVLDTLSPAAVAVELPTTLEGAVHNAVRRLPQVSLVIAEAPDEEALVWAVAPGDPFAEAIRWSQEAGVRGACVDPDVPYAERHRDPVPDPYVIWGMEGARYLQLLSEGSAKRSSNADKVREAGIAWNVKRLKNDLAGGTLLVLVGAGHVAGVSSQIVKDLAEPLARRSRSQIILRNLHPESMSGIFVDAPLIHAAFERLRDNACPFPQAQVRESIPGKVSIKRGGLTLVTQSSSEGEDARRRRLVDYVSQHSMRALYEGGFFPDRRLVGEALWRLAKESYQEQTMNELSPWQSKMFFDYGRRYARVQGSFVAGMFEWVVAARGVGDDNLAWEVFDVARTFPWQREEAELATVKIDGDELDLGTRKVRFRRRFFKVKQRLHGLHRRRHADEKPEDWLKGFNSNHICSYPPEDLVIEDYGRYLQQRAISVLNAENKRTEPFSTSMLDGVNIRETLRNFHDGRVYVNEALKTPGGAGSVVVIFDQDLMDERYPYCVTWLGEHKNESDMAFYATDPSQQIVGPGIMRGTYGGFMMSLPSGRLFDIWNDPDYRRVQRKSDVLLMAAVDYSEEKFVVHVAESPPLNRIKDYASRQGKRILHIPIGSLSPVVLKKIRVLHVLAGPDKRAIAKDYIW